jgi:F-type H+-transporting ATPase subunit epsilon
MHVEVVTPHGTALESEVDEVTAPGVRGEFGVLPGHTPFVSALKAGVLSYRAKGGKRGVLAVGPGFAEVSGRDRIVILTQQAKPADQVDVAAAQRELDDADRQLKESREAGAGRTELEARRAWAQARLDSKKS